MEFRLQPRRGGPRENVVPLINVVFLLLIFFLLTGVLRAPLPFAVEAPVVATQGAERLPELEVALGREGQLALAGERATRETLAARLGSLPPRARVALRADAAAPAHHWLPLLTSLRDAGIEHVELVVAPGRH